MLLSELLNADTIEILDEEVKDKFELLKNMAVYLGKVYKLEQSVVDKIKKNLIAREQAASTCIGKGVAIPHVEVEGLIDVMAMMKILKKPFLYGCPLDKEQTVQIVIMILFPKGEFREHILTLAGIAHLMRNEEFREKIITLSKKEEVFFYILKEEAEKLIKGVVHQNNVKKDGGN
jgi:PTS system nitrogen regulatory IIA component